MKIVAVILCAALAASWHRSVRAEEIRPDFGGIERSSDAAETYRLNALKIVDSELSNSFPTIFGGFGNWWRPVRGTFGDATTYDDFFRKMGRDDLGQQHRQRQAVAATLFWSGVIVLAGGLGFALPELVNPHTTRAEVGLGLFGGGVLIMTVGANIQPPLLSEEHAQEMVNGYNRQLQIHLGLQPVAASTVRDRLPLGLSLSRRW